VTTLNPARYVRKQLKTALEKQGVVNLNDPSIPNRHPLDDQPSDDDVSDRLEESIEAQDVVGLDDSTSIVSV
jgi:hypothetical protein